MAEARRKGDEAALVARAEAAEQLVDECRAEHAGALAEYDTKLEAVRREGAAALAKAQTDGAAVVGAAVGAGEVVGARGRIGSLLLRAGGGSLAATPRGVAPGALSPPGTPILVTAPASAVEDVLRSPRAVSCAEGGARVTSTSAGTFLPTKMPKRAPSSSRPPST